MQEYKQYPESHGGLFQNEETKSDREALRPPARNVSVGEGLKPLLYDEIVLKETPMTPATNAVCPAHEGGRRRNAIILDY
jgi:hypothetical protein